MPEAIKCEQIMYSSKSFEGMLRIFAILKGVFHFLGEKCIKEGFVEDHGERIEQQPPTIYSFQKVIRFPCILLDILIQKTTIFHE